MALLKVSWEIAGAVARGLTDRRTPPGRRLAVLGGFLASGVRFARGTVVGKLGPRPAQRFTLWDFERCPHSRIVRETLSSLDLDADVRPCPKDGTRFRPELQGRGVPQLYDPNQGAHVVGSLQIVEHLYLHYGAGSPPLLVRIKPYTIFSGISARLLTGHRGAFATPSRAPEKPLELWSFESSPFSRLARFKLCELELPYVLHNVAKGSPRRKEFRARSGKMQVPWLVDPNTGAQMFESLAIERYLQETYGA